MNNRQNFLRSSTLLNFFITDILNHPQETGVDELKKPTVPNLKGDIEYEDIWFRYNPSAPFLLKGLNLKIPAGSFVAVVGLSGSGKSTATKLLPRLYEAEKGKILVDDMDISKLELYSLRKQIGIVPQDTLLFDGSILENITLTNPSASQMEIDEAVEISCSDEFIRDLPAKFDTKVGERGSNLSGGQRQRLAIPQWLLEHLTSSGSWRPIIYNIGQEKLLSQVDNSNRRYAVFIEKKHNP